MVRAHPGWHGGSPPGPHSCRLPLAQTQQGVVSAGSVMCARHCTGLEGGAGPSHRAWHYEGKGTATHTPSPRRPGTQETWKANSEEDTEPGWAGAGGKERKSCPLQGEETGQRDRKVSGTVRKFSLSFAPELLVTKESPLNAPSPNKGEAAASPPAHAPGPAE